MADTSLWRRQVADEFLARLGGRKPKTVVGFDGFVDSIIEVVDVRTSPSAYRPMATIAEFGRRVTAAAGQSANFEFVVRQTKLGGNGPILANALVQFGADLAYLGILGEGAIHPVFASLAQGARTVISLGEPAQTDALEFKDGKLMLGKLSPVAAISFRTLCDKVGVNRLRGLLAEADLVATVNWTMTMEMTDIWKRLHAEILPGLRRDRPKWFVDLADPAKRGPESLRDALRTLTEMQTHVDVVLGLNGSEARQVLTALGKAWRGEDEDTDMARHAAEELCAALGLSTVAVHLVRSAAGADAAHGAQSSGFFCAAPLITTGAGDHFNAGFIAALTAGMDLAACLTVGTATSGWYVRRATSPNPLQLAEFLGGSSSE